MAVITEVGKGTILMARFRQAVERGVEALGIIASEIGRIPHYNAEGERLYRTMRTQAKGERAGGRVRIVRRILDRTGRDRAVVLSF